MLESGFTEHQWFALPRAERARRVGYAWGVNVLKLLSEHDAVEEAKRESAKRKRRK